MRNLRDSAGPVVAVEFRDVGPSTPIEVLFSLNACAKYCWCLYSARPVAVLEVPLTCRNSDCCCVVITTHSLWNTSHSFGADFMVLAR